MTNYSAATIPSAVFKSLLDDNWDTYEGRLRAPTVIDVDESGDGDEEGRTLRKNLQTNDLVVLRIDVPAEDEQPVGNWQYGNRTTRVLLEIYTKVNRQRLYDMAAEIRRICHAKMHTTTGFQRIQYRTFNELTQETLNVWHGRVILEAVNNCVSLSTTGF